MILTAHQPNYLPGLRLLAKIAQADMFCIFDCAQFEKHSFENRNWIKTQNGPLLLTVPVATKEHFKKTGGEITIIQNGWQRKHLRAIELAYQKAPYFDKYFPVISSSINIMSQGSLEQLNTDLLVCFLAWFELSTNVVRASLYDFQGQKSAKVLSMCQTLGATKYIFGAHGAAYADREAFAKAGIEIEFQNYQYPVYEQLHGAFVPDMSALDLLFNHGPRSREILLSGNVQRT